MESKNLFVDIVKGLEGIGYYNSEFKIYALKNEGNACKTIFDYLCKNIPLEEHEKFIRINRQTEPIIKDKEIIKLEEAGYIKLI